MKSIKDDRGYNQIWVDAKSTRVRASRRCDYMISNMIPSPEKQVLEIGCGTGANAYMLATRTGMQIFGVDLCEPFIREASERYHLPNLRYEVLDFNQPERFVGERFDYIVGNGILHHLYPELDNALANIKLLLKPKGRIIFLEPNIINPYVYFIFSYPKFRKIARLEPTEMAFSKRFAKIRLKRADFKAIKIEYKDFLLPGVPDVMINFLIRLGNIFEKTPLKIFSQSIAIVGEK